MPSSTLGDYLNTVGTRIVDQSGGTLTNANIVDFLNEEIRRTQREIDLETARYYTPINLLFGTFRYALPDGYEDFAAITWQGRINDNLDFVRAASEEDFWRNYVNRNTFAEQRNGKYRTALINFVNPKAGTVVIDECDTYDETGTWVADTVTSDAANVRTDQQFPFDGTGSVAFDIITGQSGNDVATITKTDLPSVNLSGNGFSGSGTITMNVFIPAGSVQYTSFTYKWGSSSADYYTSTVTEQADGTPFVNGTLNTLAFDWYTAQNTPTGTPNDEAIDYESFTVTFPSTLSGTVYGFRIDDITCRQKFVADFHYYSSLIVIDGTTGEPKEGFDDENDVDSYFSVDDDYVDILTYGLLETVFTYYKIDPRAAAFNKERHMRAIESYNVKYPSQRVIPVSNSYEDPPLQGLDWWGENSPNPQVR